jgi:hypothetical protein
MLPHPRLIGAAVALLCATLTPAGAQTEAEAARALAKLWQQHARAPTEHAALIQAAQQMAAQYADSPLLSVARGLGAWHALSAGQTNAARLFLTPLLADRADPISTEARVFAQRWLTRLDREQVRFGLQLYYRNHVEYPAALGALSELAATNRPPPADRFGRAWKYELAPMKRLTKLRGQRYNLASPTLGDDSDLGAMLRRPYGAGLTLWRTTRFIGGEAGGAANVEFARGAEKMVLSEGAKQAGVTLVYARVDPRGRESMIIVSDGDYWWLFAR